MLANTPLTAHLFLFQSKSFDKQLGFAWVLLLLLVFLVYSAGLSGGFIFDDYSNFVEDENVVLQNFSWEEFRRVAASGTAGPLKRPVAVVSFAIQIAATGMDPWFFKLGNVFIHLLSALALGLLIGRLLTVWGQKIDEPYDLSPQHTVQAAWAAWFAVAIWALHPLNLSSVLYVVQRMTSLTALFGFLATAVFIELRVFTAFAGLPGSADAGFVIKRILAIVVFILLSVYSKENGFIFIGLMGLIEFFIFRFRIKGEEACIFSLSLYKISVAICIFLFVFAISYSLPKIADGAKIPFRDFSVSERLMTQMRVLVFYLGEFFIPDISKMSLYHDDIEVSKSFFQPVSTIICTIFLGGVTAAVIFLAKNYPIALFAWLWFLLSHSIESTIFPLEMVHEHRNYFATVGFCVVMAIAAWKLMALHFRAVILISVVVLAVLAVCTTARAYEWSHPLILSKMEAMRHPLSSRANYQLGRDLLIAYGKDRRNEVFLAEAELAFQQATHARSNSVAPYFGLLVVEYLKSLPEQSRIDFLVKNTIEKLKNGTFEASYSGYIGSLMECQLANNCRLDDYQMLAIITAPIENPGTPLLVKAELLKIAAQYAVSKANDWAYAQMLLREAIQYYDSTSTRIVFSQILRNRGFLSLAQEQIDIAKKLDDARIYQSAIANEREKIAQLQKSE